MTNKEIFDLFSDIQRNAAIGMPDWSGIEQRIFEAQRSLAIEPPAQRAEGGPKQVELKAFLKMASLNPDLVGIPAYYAEWPVASQSMNDDQRSRT